MAGIEVRVPDIGDFEEVDVVEILVAPGDRIAAEDPVVSIESDKATMEVPSPAAGVVESIAVKLGDKVGEGSLLLVLAPAEAASAPREAVSGGAPAASAAEGAAPPPSPTPAAAPQPAVSERVEPQTSAAVPALPHPERAPGAPAPREAPVPPVERPAGPPHASPLVRREARELGVDLRRARGSGPHGRVLAEDLRSHVRSVMQGASAVAGVSAEPIDPRLAGPLEERALSHARRDAVRRLAQSWPQLPQATHFVEVDLSALEEFRRAHEAVAEEEGVQLGLLPFALLACAASLRRTPDLRASLHPDGDRVLVRQEIHIALALETEEGTLAPVLRHVDRKGVLQLARELAELAGRARAGTLEPASLQGAGFRICDLGEAGGATFSPLVHAPEVATLGLTCAQRRPVWSAADGSFVPRPVLPLSLSYDARVIAAPAAARFLRQLAQYLESPALLLL